jgi:type I restriction enzyme M protein
MALATASRYSDPYGRYYTRGGAAEVLVSAMGRAPKGVVIDLGAGDGALVGEASRRWTGASFVTVDIDQNAGSSRLPEQASSSFSHHVADALDAQLAQKIGLDVGAAHSALCNPPYIRPRWLNHFGQILEDAGLSGVFPHIKCVPADILFIAQNLRFLRSGGKLGLILPDGIIAGEKCGALRHALTTAHRLERVIELPRRMFHGTEAKAYVVVLTKQGKPTNAITLQRLQADGSLTGTLDLPIDEAISRMDYSFHCAPAQDAPKRCGRATLRDLGATVARGSFSSSERSACDFPVFHTTDFTGTGVPRAFQLSESRAKTIDALFAEPGDILVARVGRNLEEKVAVVERGRVALSDCILRIRVASELHTEVLKFFNSQPGRLALQTASHGVGAKFITREALLDMVIPGCRA